MRIATVAAALLLAGIAGMPVAQAADEMKKDGMMMKDGMKPMTMQECKDHMAMQKDGMKKDDMMMKKDTMCADMMKKGDVGMMKDGMPAKK